jgi:hypothetical protein
MSRDGRALNVTLPARELNALTVHATTLFPDGATNKQIERLKR